MIPRLRGFAVKPDKPNLILGSHKGKGEHTEHVGLSTLYIHNNTQTYK